MPLDIGRRGLGGALLGEGPDPIVPGMADYQVPVDIANRALQHCGADRIDPIQGFNENSRNASETSFVYDKVRKAELQRNTWTCATRRATLRAIDANTMLLAPSLWSQVATYFVGSIVEDQYGALWISNTPNNLGNDPLATTAWEPYFGPLAVPLYDAAGTTAYGAGELVYTAPGDGTYRVYLSLQSVNSDVPATATAYDPTVTYFKNQVVTSSAVAYMSLIDLNINQTPASSPAAWTTTFVGGTGSDKWLEIGGAEFPSGVGLTKLNIVYPLGAGPSTESFSRNAFKLPASFLRIAPQNPKEGIGALGGPTGNSFDDWKFENGYIVSAGVGPITLRFVADLTDVRLMHAMFCEGLAARIALAVCQIITQSDSKTATIASQYQKFMSEARLANAIEEEFVDPAEDELITVRL